MALSTMNSSAKRMWQKFFLLFRIAVISPHCSKTSWIISSVAFSGNPPTNTVLHPGGRSRVEGGGRSKNHNKTEGFAFSLSALFFFRAHLAKAALAGQPSPFYVTMHLEPSHRDVTMAVLFSFSLPSSSQTFFTLFFATQTGYACSWTKGKQMLA